MSAKKTAKKLITSAPTRKAPVKRTGPANDTVEARMARSAARALPFQREARELDLSWRKSHSKKVCDLTATELLAHGLCLPSAGLLEDLADGLVDGLQELTSLAFQINDSEFGTVAISPGALFNIERRAQVLAEFIRRTNYGLPVVAAVESEVAHG